MTTWHLNEDVSCCELDGRLIFLDIGRDRYFQLSASSEQRFLRLMEQPGSIDPSNVSRHKLFSRLPLSRATPEWAAPTQSALEAADPEYGIRLGMILDVCVAVAGIHRRLRKRSLKSALDSLARYRDTCTTATPAAHDNADSQRRAIVAATVFNRARPYIPVETRCLADSLAMVRFLASFGLRAQLVMGVACDPFSAHAWVQRGPLVLNDTVGNVRAHVPIRVI